MKTRFKEHGADRRHDRHRKSALAEHSHFTKHQIFLEKSRVIAKDESLTKRKVKEKIEIIIAIDFLNRDDGTKLNDTWKPLPHDLKINNNNQSN